MLLSGNPKQGPICNVFSKENLSVVKAWVVKGKKDNILVVLGGSALSVQNLTHYCQGSIFLGAAIKIVPSLGNFLGYLKPRAFKVVQVARQKMAPVRLAL